jgi:tRNA-2-methylthio-N6-dimethylallyladenosine synthase
VPINTDSQSEKQADYVRLVKEINETSFKKTGRISAAYIKTYGCQQNVSDSEHIKGMLEAMGYGFTDNAEDAGLAVFNTCAVREHAEQRVFGNVGALKGIKQRRPSMIIAVCGCMTQQEHVAEKIKNSYPYVDLVFGTHALQKLPEMLYGALEGERVFELGGGDSVTEGLPARRDSRFKVWLPVMYGCDNFCTYCIVPYVRGRERSRSVGAVVGEARELVGGGARDITLLGQNVNSYGKDLGGGVNFSELLREINAIDGDFRIRFMTSHPKDATPELFDTMACCGKVAHHLHLPFQSGSSGILKRMNRGYSKERYLELIGMIKGKIPDISLTSDIIVGFPGETYDDFLQTLDVVRKVEFDNLFTFIYSKREGTPAAKMDDPVPHGEKAKWLGELLDVQEKITSRHMKTYLGKTLRVLCDGVDGNILSGRTNGNIVVRFDGDVRFLGEFVNIRITQAHRSMLTGVITG